MDLIANEFNPLLTPQFRNKMCKPIIKMHYKYIKVNGNEGGIMLL